MGKTPRVKVPIDVSDVAPRAVYAIARLLAIKCNYIARFYTNEGIEIPENPTGSITSTHIKEMCLLAQEALSIVLKAKDIIPSTNRIALDQSKVPMDVFKQIFSINGSVNKLMPMDVSPSHVFVQVSKSINYANLFISQLRIRQPVASNFVTGYTPMDVASQIQFCLKLLGTVALAHDYELMHLETPTVAKDTLPIDVYDWATIMLYQLTYMYNITSSVAQIPSPVAMVQGKTASHVYQNTKSLEYSLNAMIGK